MTSQTYLHLGSVHGVEAFQRHIGENNIAIPCDTEMIEGANSPLGKPIELNGRKIGNRFAIHPMEGWDGTADGEPTELTERRWRNFGRCGAKLIWGGEAVAVRHDGRANPHQLLIDETKWEKLARLREALVAAHEELGGKGASDDLAVGLQITHSGRNSRPNA